MVDDADCKCKLCLVGELSPGCHLLFEVSTTNLSKKCFNHERDSIKLKYQPQMLVGMEKLNARVVVFVKSHLLL